MSGTPVQNPYRQVTTQWVDQSVRMGSGSYEEVAVDLATDVLGGRVLALHRTIVMTENDRPSAEAIFGQLIESYGKPSAMITSSYESELLYAYPMITWNYARRGALQMFGHVHNNWCSSRNAVNVGVDQWNFMPVTFHQVQIRAKKLPVNKHWEDVEHRS